MGTKLGVVVAFMVAWSSSNALAFTPEADCDGWSTTGFWGSPVHAEGTAILQADIDGAWVDVAGSVDSQTNAEAGDIELGGAWDSGPLNGTYRVALTTLVYDWANLESVPYVFEDVSTSFACVEPTEPTEPAEYAPRRTPRWWKSHPEAWPATELQIAGATYDQPCLLAVLDAPTHGDARIKLLRQLIAAELNVLAGSDPDVTTGYPARGADVLESIAAAQGLLHGATIDCDGGRCRGVRLSGRSPRGALRREVRAAASALAEYNDVQRCRPRFRRIARRHR